MEYRIFYDPGQWRLIVPPCGLRDTTFPRPGTIRVSLFAPTLLCILTLNLPES